MAQSTRNKTRFTSVSKLQGMSSRKSSMTVSRKGKKLRAPSNLKGLGSSTYETLQPIVGAEVQDSLEQSRITNKYADTIDFNDTAMKGHNQHAELEAIENNIMQGKSITGYDDIIKAKIEPISIDASKKKSTAHFYNGTGHESDHSLLKQ